MSRVPVWDYFSLTEQTYKSFLVEKKTSLLNKHFLELYQKCFVSGNFFACFFILSGHLLFQFSVCALQ